MTDKTQTMASLQSEMHGFTGTINYHRGLLNRNSYYTDGFKYFIDNAGGGAYWLYDHIQTEVYSVLKELNEPDTYYLKMTVVGTTCDLSLWDWNDKVLWKRHIGFTDAPVGKITFVVGWDGEALITCLMSER